MNARHFARHSRTRTRNTLHGTPALGRVILCTAFPRLLKRDKNIHPRHDENEHAILCAALPNFAITNQYFISRDEPSAEKKKYL